MSFLFFMAASAVASTQTPVNCPITLEPIVKGMALTDYNGVRFTYCCAGCDQQFIKDPKTALDKAAKAGKTVGVFLFDPITKKPIEGEKAKGGSSDYKGVRFFFASADEKATFDKEPAKYGALPKKEALFCPVTQEKVKEYALASGYDDFGGVRYYFCCGDCDKPFAADPAKYAPAAKGQIGDPKALTPAKPKASSL